MTTKRILYVSHSSDLAGAELSLKLLIMHLPKDTFTPIVALPQEGPLRDSFQQKGIKTHVHDSHWWIPGYVCPNLYFIDFLAGISKRVAALRELIREEKIELVHTNSVVMIDGAIAAYLENVPHVFHVREMLGQPGSGLTCILGHEMTYKIIGELSQHVIVVSNAVKGDLADFVDETKISVVYNGVDADQFESASGTPRCLDDILGQKDVFKVCTLGNVTERKGYRTLLKIVESVVAKNPEVVFLAAGDVGDPNLYDYMMESIEKGKLTKNFHFLGLKDNIPELLAAIDLLVLPSLNDPFPRVVLEAMAAAKPVIATSAGGARECVVENETGFIVEPDDVRAMSEHILELAAHPQQATHMGRLGRERIKEHFSVDRYVSKVEGIYNDLLSKEITFSEKTKDLAERILPLILNVSGDLHELWAARNMHIGELRELERLRLFEGRVRALFIYKTYHFLKRSLNKLRKQDTLEVGE